MADVILSCLRCGKPTVRGSAYCRQHEIANLRPCDGCGQPQGYCICATIFDGPVREEWKLRNRVHRLIRLIDLEAPDELIRNELALVKRSTEEIIKSYRRKRNGTNQT